MSRVLGLYKRLASGEVLYKSKEAERYNVDKRTIQRDIEDIRDYLEAEGNISGERNYVVYDRVKNGYRLERKQDTDLSNSEILAICKILLDSRAFPKKEMQGLLKKLIACSVPEERQKMIKEQVSNELFHYVEPRHGVSVTERLWDIGRAIQQNRYMELSYQRSKDKKTIKRKIKPLAIIFSEYYFYLTATIDENDAVRDHFQVTDDVFPTIYRIDRIKDFDILDERFHMPYKDRFEEGEFRKRIQFMYGGKLQKIKFKYTGIDVDAILDRLPTAQIQDVLEDGYVITAEVFGKGVDMWLKSQEGTIEIL